MEENNLIENFLNKSQEAFLMAIEIYNKPTINYRLESFAFFICNAWELLLKAKLLKENKSIYYSDKKNRSLSLSNCITTIFTNDKDPIRKNLEIILNLRNTSTHFIIKEMDNIYLPFMQANVLNYSKILFDYFNIDITKKINSAFLNLIINNEELDESKILSKYGSNILERYLKMKREADDISQSASDKLAIKFDLNIKLVKNDNEAQVFCKLSNNNSNPVTIVNKLKDINFTHNLNQKRVRELVEDRLRRKHNIEFKLNQYDLKLICTKYNLKNNEEYFYYHALTNSWCCSDKLVEFIVNLISQNINIVNEIKQELKEKKA